MTAEHGPAQRRPRVLFVASISLTLHHFASPLAERLRSRGFETVAAAGHMGPLEGFDRVHELPAFRRRGPMSVLRALRRLDAIAREERPSLIYLQTPPALVIGRLVAARRRIPSVAVVLGSFLEPFDARTVAFSIAETILARAATVTVTVNHDDHVFYRRRTRRGTVLLAPASGLGVDVERLREARARPVAVAPSPSIVVMGRLTTEKNPDRVVEAFTLLRARRPEARLTFVGDAVAGDRPWSVPSVPGVRHHPWVSDPYPVLAGADLVVHASRREGWPVVVAEASMLGVPVVAVASRGAREIARQNAPCLTLVPDDAVALADAIDRALVLGRVDCVGHGLETFWSRDRVIDFHVRVIRRAIEQRGGRLPARVVPGAGAELARDAVVQSPLAGDARAVKTDPGP